MKLTRRRRDDIFGGLAIRFSNHDKWPLKLGADTKKEKGGESK
ncbi:MAG: hypothetical protein ACQPRJ_05590 [Solitalea-like symbiont of Acarus siro]